MGLAGAAGGVLQGRRQLAVDISAFELISLTGAVVVLSFFLGGLPTLWWWVRRRLGGGI